VNPPPPKLRRHVCLSIVEPRSYNIKLNANGI
jgi:hypothetical protein